MCLYTQEPSIVWGLGLCVALVFAGREGVCRECGGFAGVETATVKAAGPVTAKSNGVVSSQTLEPPPHAPSLGLTESPPKTVRRETVAPRVVPVEVNGKRPVPILRFTRRIAHE